VIENLIDKSLPSKDIPLVNAESRSGRNCSQSSNCGEDCKPHTESSSDRQGQSEKVEDDDQERVKKKKKEKFRLISGYLNISLGVNNASTTWIIRHRSISKLSA
jgi:hypothetical protein